MRENGYAERPPAVRPGPYVRWLVAVVLLLLGRYTGFPALPGTYAGVVLGTTVFVVLGAGTLVRGGHRRLAGGTTGRHEALDRPAEFNSVPSGPAAPRG